MIMLEYNFSYRKLNVYQLSRNLVKEIYKLVNSFPKNEIYALGDQMRRAVVSIPSNIAEGTDITALRIWSPNPKTSVLGNDSTIE